jgi:hypothetical protein
LLHNVYCVCDGLKVRLQSCSNHAVQGMNYNGWKQDHYLSNLFVFAPDGKVIFCLLNDPGSLHDSTSAEWSDLYNILNNIWTRTGGQCCMDSAFAALNNPAVIRSIDNITNAQNELEMLKMIQATSLRQSAKWGLRALQSASPCIKQKIRFEERGDRKIFLMAITLLNNYCCTKVGLNQIRSVYSPNLNKDPVDLYFL